MWELLKLQYNGIYTSAIYKQYIAPVNTSTYVHITWILYAIVILQFNVLAASIENVRTKKVAL